MSGDRGFPYLERTDPYPVNFDQYNNFVEAGESSRQLRHNCDSASLEVPGLSLTTRYFSDHDAKLKGVDDSREWERSNNLYYAL